MALRDFDRRWIFLAMGLIVVGLYVRGTATPMKVNKYVHSYFDTIEALEAGDIVMLSADFDPASAAELGPMYHATVHHLLSRDIRVINLATWPAAPPFIKEAFTSIPPLYGKQYGTDWIELGFKPGDDVAMGSIAQSIRSSFPTDEAGTPIDELPLMADVGESLQGIEVLITLSAGYPGILEWIAQVGGRYNMPLLTGTTAVQTPDLFAFYPNQLAGFLGAATGATQYIQLVDAGLEVPAGETQTALTASREENQKRMLVQSWSHMLIILLIVVGNVIYFTGRGRAA